MLTIPVYDPVAQISVRTHRLAQAKRWSALAFYISYGVLFASVLLAMLAIGVTLNGAGAAIFVLPIQLALGASAVCFITNLICDARLLVATQQDFDAFFDVHGQPWFTAHSGDLPQFNLAQQRTLLRGDAVILGTGFGAVRYLPTRDAQTQAYQLHVAERVPA